MGIEPQFIYIGISTHSLTKRLTAAAYCQTGSFDISTHSLTKRLTSCNS